VHNNLSNRLLALGQREATLEAIFFSPYLDISTQLSQLASTPRGTCHDFVPPHVLV